VRAIFQAMFLVPAMLASFFALQSGAEAIERSRPTPARRASKCSLVAAPGLELHASHRHGILAHDAVHRVCSARRLERAGGDSSALRCCRSTQRSSISRTTATRTNPPRSGDEMHDHSFLYAANPSVRCSRYMSSTALVSGTSRDSRSPLRRPAVKDVLLLSGAAQSTSCSFPALGVSTLTVAPMLLALLRFSHARLSDHYGSGHPNAANRRTS